MATTPNTTTVLGRTSSWHETQSSSLEWGLFILLGSFFFVNLFIGVLYDRFMEMQDKLKGKSMFLTPEQQDNLDTLRLGLKFKPLREPRAPDDELGRITFKFSTHPLFDPFIVFCIVLNTIAMAVVHFGRSPQRYAMIRPTIAACTIRRSHQPSCTKRASVTR